MNTCYYCNNSRRGCPECRKAKQEEPKPVWKLLDMGEAGESLKLVERHPIKDDRKLERVLGEPATAGAYLRADGTWQQETKGALLDADWATQVLWLKCVQHSLDLIDGSIRLELVREPSNRYPMLISRTNFEFMADRMQRTRVQAWSLFALYSSKAVMADDPDLTAKFIAQWWEVRRQQAYQQETTTPKGPASTKINFVPATSLKVDAQLPETWEQQEPNVYPSVTDSLTLWGDEVNKLTERDMLTPHMRAPDPIHSMPLKALPREHLITGELVGYFDSPELRAWINGSWDNLPDGDDQEDEALDAIYYGSRAGGKMLAHQEQVYRDAEAQQPMLLIHDEVTTYVDPESEYAKECAKPLNLQDLGKLVEKFEALSPESKRQVPNMRTLSIDLGSQPGWTTFRSGEYEMRLRSPYSIESVAARMGLYWQRRALDLLAGVFKDNEPKD